VQQQSNSLMKNIRALLVGCVIGCIAAAVVTSFLLFWLSDKFVENELDVFPAIGSVGVPATEPLSQTQAPDGVLKEARSDLEKTRINS